MKIQQELLFILGYIFFLKDFISATDSFYFRKWPEGARIAAGQPHSLPCSVSDNTSITYSWSHDGTPVTSTPRKYIDGAILRFTRVEPSDIGEYSCIAHNSSSGFALTSLPARLTVLWVSEEAKVLVVGGLEPRAGDPLALRCKVDGGPELSYKWFRNGEPVETLGGVSIVRKKLMIASVTPARDNGVYTCIARTPSPHSTKSIVAIPFVLALQDGSVPMIEEIPEGVVVPIGTRASLHCRFESGTKLNWYHQSQGPLTDSKRLNVHRNGTLVILSAGPEDTGIYKCVGVHPRRHHEQTYAAEVTLAYLNKEEPILEPGKHEVGFHVVGLGGSLKVNCLPPSGLPTPSITWIYKNRRNLPTEGSLRQEGSWIVVDGAELNHAGDYICQASNQAGNISTVMTLYVTSTPVLESGPQSIQVLEGETAKLECRVDAPRVPLTKISWIRNGKMIAPDGYRLIASGAGVDATAGGSSSLLRIRWVKQEDAGSYKCSINTLGHPLIYSKSSNITIVDRLKFSVIPKDSRVELNTDINIPCKAIGATQPKINWRKILPKNEVLKPADELDVTDDGTLRIKNAGPADEGRYVCIANNEQGSINKTMFIVVVQAPILEWMTPGPVEVEVGGVLNLKCRAQGRPTPVVNWDFNHSPTALATHRAVISNNGTLTVQGVRKADSGLYGCIAGNMAGLARAQVIVNVSDNFGGVLGRTIGVAVGGAAAYIALVGALLIYCRQRKNRRKHSAQCCVRATATLVTNGPSDADHMVCEVKIGERGQPNRTIKQVVNHLNSNGSISTFNHIEQNQRNINNDHQIYNYNTPNTSPVKGEENDSKMGIPSQSSTYGGSGSICEVGISQASTHTVADSSTEVSSSPSQQLKPNELLSKNPENISHISRNEFNILLTLGRGEFGEVQLARLIDSDKYFDSSSGSEDLVMIKVISTRDEHLLAEISREALMFGGPAHDSIASTFGLCNDQKPHLLISRYTDWGDLKQFLLASRQDSSRPSGGLCPPPLTSKQILKISLQAAEGLEYLAARRHTHKDIAARNCLITSTLNIKLSCPALSRDAYTDEYYLYRNSMLPIRWLAPEALIEDDHSMKSSVFSWAWLVWEIYMGAILPHKDISDLKVISLLESEELECTAPEKAPESLSKILSQCWNFNPKYRPPISDIVVDLKAIIDV